MKIMVGAPLTNGEQGSSLKILLSYHYRTYIRLLISDCEPTGPRFDEGGGEFTGGNASGTPVGDVSWKLIGSSTVSL